MSYPQSILLDIGGTVETFSSTRPDAATVTLRKFDNSAIVEDADATVSTIDTTLSSAAGAGATSVEVASATGIANGSRFWVKDDPEECVVVSVSGTTVTLRRPLKRGHASGATVEGSRVHYTVAAGDADEQFWDGRIEWSFDGSLHHYSALCCLRYNPMRLASEVDLEDEDPRLYNRIVADYDVRRALDKAHQDVLMSLAENGKIIYSTSGMELIQAVVFAFYRNYYRPMAGEEATELIDRYEKAYESELLKIRKNIPRDQDMDGKINEKSQFGSAKIWRA